MQQIADLHIHSKYSRACSRDLTLANIDKTCRIKGVDIIATGDFTYPQWFNDIKEELEENGLGLYKLKKAEDDKIKFILSTELALIYKKGDRARRIHIVVHAPNISAAAELNKYLDKHYNIRSDGRPILGMSTEELMKLCLSIHPQFLIYPAHIWTPWFSVFGSKSGFDTMEECFGEFTKDIYAYETGLSSDPEMNWRLSALDRLTLLSNSDAHSLPNIGREANVFEMDAASYSDLYEIIKNKIVSSSPAPVILNGAKRSEESQKLGNNKQDSPMAQNDKGIAYTIEFYPEEGMYHYDGHRDCQMRMVPAESKKHKGICPVCKKPLTIGVLNRVEELADRSEGFRPEGVPDFMKLVELDKIIAEAMGVKSRTATKVQIEYHNLVKIFANELRILIEEPLENIEKVTLPEIAEGIRRVRAGELTIEPGFDGQYGTVKIFSDQEKSDKQKQLF